MSDRAEQVKPLNIRGNTINGHPATDLEIILAKNQNEIGGVLNSLIAPFEQIETRIETKARREQ